MQTDMTNLRVAFRNVACAPKMLLFKNVTNENAHIRVTTFKKNTHTSRSDAPCSLTGGEQDHNTTGGTTREIGFAYEAL
jgi:hypothetical protein